MKQDTIENILAGLMLICFPITIILIIILILWTLCKGITRGILA